MHNIGEKVKTEIETTIDTLLSDYLKEIDEAYALAGGDDLDIAFKVRLSPHEKGGVEIQSQFSFIKGVKVKDGCRSSAEERQMDLTLAQNTDSSWDKFYNEIEADCESEDIDFF